MADKELRKMNRTELIEIIYTLKQNDTLLRNENDELRRKLEDKIIRIDNAGSIAEAALSLNHIFEDAENASKQYLETLENADTEAKRILDDAKAQANEIISDARNLLEKTRAECDAITAESEREANERLEIANQKIRSVLEKYPELVEYMIREQKEEGAAEPDGR